MTSTLRNAVIAVIVLVVGMAIALALAPAPHGHDHDHGKIAAIMSVDKLDAGPSCTHTRNEHYHDSGRIRHVTDYGTSHKHGSAHHHHGKLTVYSAGSYSINYDKQCPKH